MNKENIFTTASVKNSPVGSDELKDLEMVESTAVLRKIIREFVLAECYGWPVEKEENLYSVKASKKRTDRDPKNALLKLPRGRNSRDKA